jgi:hypothetical protein
MNTVATIRATAIDKKKEISACEPAHHFPITTTYHYLTVLIIIDEHVTKSTFEVCYSSFTNFDPRFFLQFQSFSEKYNNDKRKPSTTGYRKYSNTS